MSKEIGYIPTISAYVQSKVVCLVGENSVCHNKGHHSEECVKICFLGLQVNFSSRYWPIHCEQKHLI